MESTFRSKNLNVLKIQWIFVISLGLFVKQNFRGTCSSVEMLNKVVHCQRKVGNPCGVR